MDEGSNSLLVLVVAGSSLRAEEADRPLAYYLRQEIERLAISGAGDSPKRRCKVLVVADFRWLNEKAWRLYPTISVGGPGVNALAHRWLEELPVTLAVDEQFYIQMDPNVEDLRASVWGMDNPSTQIAVSTFVQRFLPRFLEQCQNRTADPTDSGD